MLKGAEQKLRNIPSTSTEDGNWSRKISRKIQFSKDILWCIIKMAKEGDILSTTEQTHQQDLERLKALRYMDDDFMTVCLADNFEGVELILRIVLGQEDIKIKSIRTQEPLKNLQGRSRRWCKWKSSFDTASNYPFVCINFDFSWLNKARPISQCIWAFNSSGFLTAHIACGHVTIGPAHPLQVYGIRNKPPKEAF